MQYTLATIAAGYLIGTLPTDRLLPFRKPSLQLFCDMVKGAAAARLALAVIGTEFSMILTALAALIGHTWHPYSRSFTNDSPNMAPALGTLLFLSPSALVAMASAWLAVYLLCREVELSSVLSFLGLPLFLWYFKPFDVYLLFGLTCSSLKIYQYINYIGKSGKTAPKLLAHALQQKALLQKALFFTLVLLVSISLFFNRYVYRGFGMQIDLIRSGNPEFNLVALTFDDGPDPLYTPLILDILMDYDVKASFFLIGRHVEQYPEIARRIVNEGHDIGSHTYSHRNLVSLGYQKTKEEIKKAEEAILEATGLRPYLFRPPRGLYSASARELLREEQYTIVLWSLSTRDWAELSVRDMVGNVLKKVKPGDIILFHDSGNLISTVGGNRMNTVKALPLIIEGLQARGYTIVPVSDLLLISGLTTTETLD
ncbi:MAG TPA: polysaccharide deacetylase family protein [Firmicutes bacterium]|nr:polysaccharide deacetylase family protein [Bacillota bacterium]